MNRDMEMFKQAVLQSGEQNLEIHLNDEYHVTLENAYAYGEVVFRDIGIVELMAKSRKDDEVIFYLHFQPNDQTHAIALLEEMIDAMKKQAFRSQTSILLCCSCGITTNYFCEKLRTAAEAMSLDYKFDAVSFDRVYQMGPQYDVILVAPQIAHLYEKVKSIMPNKAVFKIPTRAFAQYNAGIVIDLIRSHAENMQRYEERAEEPVIDVRTKNTFRILVMEMIADPLLVRIGYRLYDGDTVVLDKEVIKGKLDIRDFEDIAATVAVSYPNVEAISISMPGIIQDGKVDLPVRGYEHFDLKSYMEKRFGIPVFVINDVNAAAVGYYTSQSTYRSLLFHFQPLGEVTPGQGNIVHGRLVHGYHNIAGELKYLLPFLKTDDDVYRAQWTPEGTLKLVAMYILAALCVSGPKAVIVRSDLITEVGELRSVLETMIPAEYVPQLFIVKDMKEYMFAGQLLEACTYLRKQA